MSNCRRRAVVAGIGQTEFSPRSGRSEARLAVEATVAAIEDARIPESRVQGLVTFNSDTTHEIVIARNLGLDHLTYTGRTTYGGSDYCTTLLQAKLVVEAGVADAVVCYRAFNERSGLRFGQGFGIGFDASTDGLSSETDHWSLTVPFGLRTAAGWIGMFARRYMWEYGVESSDLAEVAVSARAFAATNPSAHFYDRPITVADHQSSRFIVEPLRLLDCCLETDGGAAVVVTSEDLAKASGSDFVTIASAATAAGPDQHLMTSYYREDMLDFAEITGVARQVWREADITYEDVDLAILYDHFTPMVMCQLEAWGFCARGEARDLIAERGIGPGGELPVNPHGGQLGEGYLHGMNGITEAVRQLRGTASNQVPGARTALVSAPPGTPSSGMVLVR